MNPITQYTNTDQNVTTGAAAAGHRIKFAAVQNLVLSTCI